MFVRAFPKLEHNSGREHNIGGGRQVLKTYETSFHWPLIVPTPIFTFKSSFAS